MAYGILLVNTLKNEFPQICTYWSSSNSGWPQFHFATRRRCENSVLIEVYQGIEGQLRITEPSGTWFLCVKEICIHSYDTKFCPFRVIVVHELKQIMQHVFTSASCCCKIYMTGVVGPELLFITFLDGHISVWMCVEWQKSLRQSTNFMTQ